MISIAIHAFILIVLALLLAQSPTQTGGLGVLSEMKRLEDLSEGMEIDAPIEIPSDSNAKAETSSLGAGKSDLNDKLFEMLDLGALGGNDEANREHDLLSGQQLPPTLGTPGGKGLDFVDGGGLEGRDGAKRSAMLNQGLITGGSEAAVEAGLQWLAAHQCNDGGWNFDLSANNSSSSGCGRCGNSGSHGSRVAATALALMPFLGAGYTHLDGKHKRVVDRGLVFLVRNGREGSDGSYDFCAGTFQRMYTQGLATLVLCEAYAMTGTEILQSRARGGLDFIIKAQDIRHTGGWRYEPQMSGDTSVTGWQVMALKSGKLAGFAIPRPTLYRTNDFLDLVQEEGGRRYVYLPDRSREGTGPDTDKTCTAIGLLSRMYFGWAPGDPVLDQGIQTLQQWGPFPREETCNLYYIYYGALALHHHGTPAWAEWYGKTRDYLIRTQQKHGCESGSWFFSDVYCDVGGRLLNTALAVMVLEVPYRYLPLYKH